MNRRQSITAVGVAGILTGTGSLTSDAADERDKTTFAGEKPVLFKLKNVTLDAVDEEHRTVEVSFGRADSRVRLGGLPIALDIHILRWFSVPSIANNLPFRMDRLTELVGKQVSMHLRAERSGLAVAAIATAND